MQIIEQLQVQESPLMALTVSPVYQVSSDLTPRGQMGFKSRDTRFELGDYKLVYRVIGWPRLDVESDLVGFFEPEYPAN